MDNEQPWYTVNIGVIMHNKRTVDESDIRVGNQVPMTFQYPMDETCFNWAEIVKVAGMGLEVEYAKEEKKVR